MYKMWWKAGLTVLAVPTNMVGGLYSYCICIKLLQMWHTTDEFSFEWHNVHRSEVLWSEDRYYTIKWPWSGCSIQLSAVLYLLSNHIFLCYNCHSSAAAVFPDILVFVRFVSYICIGSSSARPSERKKNNRLMCCVSADSLSTQKSEWMREGEREATDRLCKQLVQIKIFGQTIIPTCSWEG